MQRLNASVEAVEQASVSQKRQIEALGNEIQKLREENAREAASRATQRPWADDIKRQSDELRRHSEDLKRLADAVAEVDRKRAADHEQVLKVLGEMRKAVAAIAEAPPARTAPTRSAPSPEARNGGDRSEGDAKPAAAKETPPVKAVPYTVGKGESLSLIVDGFNQDAKKKGYQVLTIQQVMKFNKITDARRIREGMTLNLPLYPKAEK